VVTNLCAVKHFRIETNIILDHACLSITIIITIMAAVVIINASLGPRPLHHHRRGRHIYTPGPPSEDFVACTEKSPFYHRSYTPHVPEYHMSNSNILLSIVNNICSRPISASGPRFFRRKRYLEILFFYNKCV